MAERPKTVGLMQDVFAADGDMAHQRGRFSARIRLRRGLKKLEIRDYALRSAGGLSEATPSCALLISVFSIVPDFLVFAATEPRSRSRPHTRAEYVFYNRASLFSDVLL